MSADVVCPGCGLAMPRSGRAAYDGYFHTSPECWSVLTEVMEAEFSDAVLFGAVHQLTVDTYAVQHAGGAHPDKSVGVHLSGLHLVLEKGCRPTRVAPLLQRMARSIARWPHFPPPADRGGLTVFDVALTPTPSEHAEKVREWAASVWESWSAAHAGVAELVERHLEPARTHS